jgi:beta-lactamase regulating signal transducer with metallopeptidase domain
VNAWLSLVGLWLTDFAWLATALLAAALLLRPLLREPGSRVLLTWGAWLVLGLAAVLTMLPGWPRWNIGQLMTTAEHEPPAKALTANELVWLEPIRLADSPAADAELIASIPQNTALVAAALEMPLMDSRWTGLEWFAVGWLVVTALASAWICVGLWQVRRLVRRAEPAPKWIDNEHRQIREEQAATIDVFISGRLSSAVAMGALRPRILLPREAAVETNVKGIRAALAHEGAHIRHGDLWLLAMERVLVPLLAAHPLFWWLRQSTRLDQEFLADAVAAGERPVEYAEALVGWANAAGSSPVGLAALGIWERPSNLTRRVKMILNHNRPLSTRFGRLCGLATSLVLLGLVVALSTLSMQPLTADDDPAAGPEIPSATKAQETPPAEPRLPTPPKPPEAPTLAEPPAKPAAPARPTDPASPEAVPVLDPPSLELPQNIPGASASRRAPRSVQTQRSGPSLNPRGPSVDPEPTAASGEQVLLEQVKRSLEQLARERDERIKENMSLRKQIEQLNRELAQLRRQPESDAAPTLQPQLVPGQQLARPSEPIAQRPVADSAARRARETEARLLELDLADAKLGVEEAQAEVQAAQQMREKGAIGQQEMRQRELKVERAKIQMQRIQVRLEAAREVSQTESGPTLAPRR